MRTVVPSQVVAHIDARMPNAAAEHEGGPSYELAIDHAGVVRGVLALVDAIPPHLVTLDQDKYAGFVEATEVLRAAVDVWTIANNRHHKIGKLFGTRPPRNALTIVREALSKCRDEAPHPATAELAFVTDAALREALRTDASAANQALGNGEWKAATVLAGSVVEALLLWALDEHEAQNPGTVETAANAVVASGMLKAAPPADFNQWVLAQLIAVAEEAKLISKETASQSRLAKDFRNLIHPGRSKRLGQACDRGTALSAVAAVEHVARDLTP